MAEAPYLAFALAACGSLTLLILGRAARDVIAHPDAAKAPPRQEA